MDASSLKIISANPIGDALNGVRALFKILTNDGDEDKPVLTAINALAQLGAGDFSVIAKRLISTLHSLPAADQLPSKSDCVNLREDLNVLRISIIGNAFDFLRILPLLDAVLAEKQDDAEIWYLVYSLTNESTPPPSALIPFEQTPWRHNSGSFVNSLEYRKDVDKVLLQELGHLYVGLPAFYDTYFGRVTNLDAASKAVFQKCTSTDVGEALFYDGWKGWPEDANQDDVLECLSSVMEKIAEFAHDHGPPQRGRRPLARPNVPIYGSTGERKMDIGLVNDPNADKNSRCHWSQVLVPGELKNKTKYDTVAAAWLDLGRYAREVLAAQYSRRFVLGFTLCGSMMRVWEFDRIGGIASMPFDINKSGLQFVQTILGFLWMSEEDLGFDPTISTISEGQQYMEIQRNGLTERLIIDLVVRRERCVDGRATTIWKAHSEHDPGTPLVIKDSWQYLERPEEGELLQTATDKGVVNVARYYHHETVRVGGADDEIMGNIRKGLDVEQAANYRARHLTLAHQESTLEIRSKGSRDPSPSHSRSRSRGGGSSHGSGSGRGSGAGKKRLLSELDAPQPPRKRIHSPSSAAPILKPSNRVHRRVVVRDYGKPIYKASSCKALLAALEGCIQGHESLHQAGFLHRDISINNLMINEDENNPSWSSFLIDLDLCIKETREAASGARSKTGTRAFMAIGVLEGEQHSFMHDLESFFWVLFWICVHYEKAGKGGHPSRFDIWNYTTDDRLVDMKMGVISVQSRFLNVAQKEFSWYYQPLIPYVDRLRAAVFPKGESRSPPNPKLYDAMKHILQEAQNDLSVTDPSPKDYW